MIIKHFLQIIALIFIDNMIYNLSLKEILWVLALALRYHNSTKSAKLMEKQAKREKKLAEKKAKRLAKEGPKKEE